MNSNSIEHYHGKLLLELFTTTISKEFKTLVISKLMHWNIYEYIVALSSLVVYTRYFFKIVIEMGKLSAELDAIYELRMDF